MVCVTRDDQQALDPPPWLAQMRRLGYPPGYLVAQADESPRLAIYEDEGGLTTVLLAAEEEAASLLPSPSPPAAAVDGSEIEEGEMEVSMDLESSEEDGEDGEAVAASTLAPTMAVAYPGINSPIPDGADPRAWGLPSQSVNPGETASRRTAGASVTHMSAPKLTLLLPSARTRAGQLLLHDRLQSEALAVHVKRNLQANRRVD
eukprot:SM000327S12490  [mRNA]  locus=s327:95636:97372:- [translate_table: standard]